MTVEQLSERLAALEAQHAAFVKYFEGEKLSLLANDREVGEQVVRLDEMLRGEGGNNGLVGRVGTLERRWSLVLWAAGVVAGGAITAGWRLVAG